MLHRSARPLLDRLPALTDRVTALIRQHEPAYGPPAFTSDALWREVHASLRLSVGSLLRPRELREDARRCSRRIGAAGPARGLPLDAVLHAFRIGGAVVWQDLLDVAAQRDPQHMRLLVHVAEDVWSFVDEHCTVVTEAYRRAERELSWRRADRHRLTVEALLHGTARLSELPDAAALLGLPERARYAVVAVTGTGRAAAREAADTDGLRFLWHPAPADADPDGVDFALVLLGEPHVGSPRGPHDSRGSRSSLNSLNSLNSREDDGPERLSQALRARLPLSDVELRHPGAAPAPFRAGIGTPVDGLAAVGEARASAETALRATPAEGGVTLLQESLPAALMVSSPALAALLTERVLGPVLRLEPGDRDVLLDTLAVFLDHGASAQPAAERLSCHRNTVLNRLRRYERLTGRTLGSPHHVAELSLALTALRLPAVRD